MIFNKLFQLSASPYYILLFIQKDRYKLFFFYLFCTKYDSAIKNQTALQYLALKMQFKIFIIDFPPWRHTQTDWERPCNTVQSGDGSFNRSSIIGP